jgi:WD40 repeat protein
MATSKLPDAPWVIAGHKKWLNGVLVCGSQVYSFGQDGRVCCFSAISHTLLFSLRCRTAVHAVAVPPPDAAAGLPLFTAGDEGELLAWQPGESCAVPSHSLRGHTGVVRCLALNTERDALWSAGSGDCVVQRWALGPLRAPPVPAAAPLSILPISSLRLEGHTGPVTHLQLARHGAMLVSSSSDGTARAWCTLSNTCLALFAAAGGSPVTSLAVAGDSLHVGCEDGAWRLWPVPEAADAEDVPPVALVQPPCLVELVSAGAAVTSLLLDVARAHVVALARGAARIGHFSMRVGGG